ncbi:MAG: tRNA dimethylallyltransferase [Candidatus Electronema aureum]|uniref:tRNA dimethylallyltransferase n=1 Tax=Candidatus Electronema aureum TaxID=2005002 RepID=A0A521G5K6_9BACT|nr:MAG: tRNA dimethylallyltransferase [Candidatus Electronema aureum]
MKSVDCPVIVLVGPTAVGKTELSFRLAEQFNCEIISMDSMQVYRGMDIGTAKPSLEERAQLPHHLIDIAEPDEQYDAARFVRDALTVFEGIAARRKTALLTGGTGLYLKALFEGLFNALPTNPEIREQLRRRLELEGRTVLHAELSRIDPAAGARIHPNDTQRLLRGLEIFQASGRTWTELIEEQKQAGQGRAAFSRVYLAGLRCDKTELHERIARRSLAMIESGLIEEVERLRQLGYGPELPSMQAIGYRHVNRLLADEWTQAEMLDQLILDTRRYAKRQMTWFTANKELRWFRREEYELMADEITSNLSI